MSAPAAPLAAVLLDIEGTTTPTTFVYDELFPYSRRHMGEFLRRHAGSGLIARELAELEVVLGRSLTPDSAAAALVALLDGDSKLPALKTIQGKIWAHGYECGDLRGELYEDVEPALRRWRAQGTQVFTFSSASVQSQRLLFAHSVFGDLSWLISGCFDTRMGGKRQAASYSRIVRRVGVAPGRMLFVSDVRGEVDAAAAVGVRTTLCARGEASDELTGDGHPVIRSFDEL